MPYHTAKSIQCSRQYYAAKFKDCQYFQLYGITLLMVAIFYIFYWGLQPPEPPWFLRLCLSTSLVMYYYGSNVPVHACVLHVVADQKAKMIQKAKRASSTRNSGKKDQ